MHGQLLRQHLDAGDEAQGLPRPRTTIDEISRYLAEKDGIVCLGSLGFENAYGFALPAREAERLNVHSLADLARLAGERAKQGKRLKIGGDTQFFLRPEWARVKEAYGLKEDDIETKPMDQTFMYGAVDRARSMSSSPTPATAASLTTGWRCCSDPERALPPYDAILLLSPEAAKRPGTAEALRPLLGQVSQEAMRQANLRVDMEKWPARRAAAELDEPLSPSR